MERKKIVINEADYSHKATAKYADMMEQVFDDAIDNAKNFKELLYIVNERPEFATKEIGELLNKAELLYMDIGTVNQNLHIEVSKLKRGKR